jgi:hypothetical protein
VTHLLVPLAVDCATALRATVTQNLPDPSGVWSVRVDRWATRQAYGTNNVVVVMTVLQSIHR